MDLRDIFTKFSIQFILTSEIMDIIHFIRNDFLVGNNVKFEDVLNNF